MAPVVSVKELYRRLVACTFEDGKVRDLHTALEILKTLESTKMTVNDLQETRFGRLVNNIRRNNSDATLCRQSKKLIRLWQRVASELNDSQLSNGGTPGASQQRRGTTPAANIPTSSATKARNPPPKMAPIAARSPAVSNGPTRGRPRKDAAAAQTPSKLVSHLRNGHDVTPIRSTSKSRVATPKTSSKRKVTTPNNSTAVPPGKRAKMTSQSSLSSSSSNNRVESPAQREESRNSRKSEMKFSALSAKKSSVESEEFTTRVADNGLKIRIKKPPKTAAVINNSTSGYQTRPNGQQQSNMHHHHHHHHHPNSPHSPDSIDSDRTTVDTPPDVTSRLRPSSSTSSVMTSSITNHYTASTRQQIKPNACSGLARAIFRPPLSRESLPVHFDVTTDPYFCSTLQPSEGQRCVMSSTDDGEDVEEIHGVNGCRGDNGKWYPWNEGILLKHRTQVVLNDEYDEGLLSILPYVEVE